MRHATLTIEGMTCSHCVAAVDRALRETGGVQVEGVEMGTASVSYDPEQIDADRIRQAVEAEGYPVRQLMEAGA
jgi:copper chaperone